MELGEIVISKAGRDSGRYFVVVEIVSSEYVKIADGDYRRIKNAKLKKIKHLTKVNGVLDKIQDKLKNGRQVFDAELFSALRFYKEAEE